MHLSATGSMAVMLPLNACRGDLHDHGDMENLTAFQADSLNLLTTWCDAMIRDQVDNPSDPEQHGALYCHACGLIHGRCPDSVYPFLYMADHTGDQKYLDAAIKVMEWSVNVDKPDGSWTVVPNPKSWNGTTVFGAIALGEALHHHGHVLPEVLKKKWEERLKRAIEFVYNRFDMNFSHINYRFTAIYALNFLGRYFNEEKYIKRSREFAADIPKWLTEPNKLIFGEDSPDDEKSAKGLYPVDLGYNVEESLNGVVQFAVLEKDESLLALLTSALNGHLEFMLPDGAWDNSWGTRQNKWTYWGSRTTDGCQPAFTLMADRNPAFGTAAVLNTELLQRCTVNGLLAGGLHYESYGEVPCIHHTFAHAKSLAFVLDHKDVLKKINKEIPIPRSTDDGIKYFPELDVWLGARGPWRCTVSSYDQVWKKKYSVPGIGGSLSVLWHEKVGPLFTASMAEYIEVEPYNQQPQPGEDFCLTPRVERYVGDTWYTSAHDLTAEVKYIDTENAVLFDVDVVLTDREKKSAKDNSEFKMQYAIGTDITIIKATRNKPSTNGDTLVLPLISPSHDEVKMISNTQLSIKKDNCTVVVESSVPMSIKPTEKSRVFNQVPGVEVVPIMVVFPKDTVEVSCSIRVV